MKVKEFVEYRYEWECPHCSAPNFRNKLVQRNSLQCGQCGTRIKRSDYYYYNWEIVVEKLGEK